MLMIGDFIFALSMAPVHLGIEWWQNRINSRFDGFEMGRETTSSESSDDVNISDIPTSFVSSSAGIRTAITSPGPMPDSPGQEQGLAPSRRSTGESATLRRPTMDTATSSRRSTREKVPTDIQSRRPSGSAALRSKAPDNTNLEPNFFEASRRRSGSPLRQDTSNISPSSSPKGTPRQHQIWYPPRNSSSDDDGFLQTALAQQQQLDEWREYPAFPSAYPPTPIAVTSRLVTTAISNFPPIEEDPPRQDFRQSLLPPREPLNPSPALDSSDKMTTTFGNSPSINIMEDSVSSDDYDEDEDQFNITLRTPLPALGSLRSQIQPRRLVSIISASSAASVPSRASALTTSDNGSPLRTNDAASDSSLSSRPVVESASVIGKKRSYPRNDSQVVANRVRHIEETESRETSEDDLPPVTLPLRIQNRKPLKSVIPCQAVASSSSDSANEKAEPMPSSADDGAKDDTRQTVPPEEKRRKVVRTSHTTRPVVAPAARPVRARVTKPATSQVQKGKFLEVPTVPKRASTRLRPGTTASASQHQDGEDTLSGSSASISDEPRSSISLKPSGRNLARKR
jgi:hypothetical protein